MTILPSIETTSTGVLLTLDNGAQLLLRTETQARQLGDLCRDAEERIAQQVRDRAARLDQDTAKRMAEADAKKHKRYGFTLQGWPPERLLSTQPHPANVELRRD